VCHRVKEKVNLFAGLPGELGSRCSVRTYSFFHYVFQAHTGDDVSRDCQAPDRNGSWARLLIGDGPDVPTAGTHWRVRVRACVYIAYPTPTPDGTKKGTHTRVPVYLAR